MTKSGNIIRYTAAEIDEMIKRGEDQTDWARLESMTDEEIERNAHKDEREHGGADFDGPSWVGLPPDIGLEKQQLTVRYDKKVIDYFKGTGKGYQTRMNAVLRDYVERRLKQDAS